MGTNALNALAGIPAGVLGMPVDLMTMAMRPFGYSVPQEQVVGSADWIGRKAGADPGNPAFIAGQFASPDPVDAVKLAGLLDPNALMALGGMSRMVGEVPKRFKEIPGTDWDEAARLYAETGEAPIGRGHRLVRTKHHYEGMEPFESTDLYEGSEHITGYSDFDDAKSLLAEDFGPRRKWDMTPPQPAPNEPRYFGPDRDDELLSAMEDVGKDWSLRQGFGMVAVGDFNHFDQAILDGGGADLYAKSAPVRRLLREKYGDTIILYRSQDPSDFGRLIDGKIKPTLFAGDYSHALRHGGQETPLYKFEVPVDDVIVAVGAPGTGYAEFVIRNPDYPELPSEWKK